MFRNVLIGVDGTPDGLDAVALATVLADRGASLTLAHVYAGRPTPGRVSNRLFRGFYEPAHADSIGLLEAARAETGVSAALISVGAPSVGRGLHTLTEEHGADLLVVGSCGRGPVGRVVIGDDTRASLNGAACVVAIAP